MFLLVIHVVLLLTQHLCFDMQKFCRAYAASPVHIPYGRRNDFRKLATNYVTSLLITNIRYHEV